MRITMKATGFSTWKNRKKRLFLMKLDSSSLSSPSFHIQETDWILVVRGGGGGGSGETSTAQTVLQRLADRGWRFKVHKLGGSSTAAGSSSKLLFGIFVKCPPAVFKEEFVKQMAQAQAGGEMHSSISDLDTFLKNTIQPAQRLRITHYALTCPGYLGGLGFTTREEIDRTGFSSSMKSFAGDISDPSPPIVLEYIFSLHDQTFCKEWIYKWSHKLFLTESDLTDIRNMLGEKTAFYFAFLQYYTIFLIIPSAIGLYFSWSTPSNQRYS